MCRAFYIQRVLLVLGLKADWNVKWDMNLDIILASLKNVVESVDIQYIYSPHLWYAESAMTQSSRIFGMPYARSVTINTRL